MFNAMLALGMGSIILAFHFVWEWPMILVTLYGVMQMIKGLVFLTFPSIGLKSIESAHLKFQKFRWVGLIMFIGSVSLIIKLVGDEAFK